VPAWHKLTPRAPRGSTITRTGRIKAMTLAPFGAPPANGQNRLLALAVAKRDAVMNEQGDRDWRDIREALGESEQFMDPNARIDLTHVDPTQLAGNPFERKSNWSNVFRSTGSRGWAAAALAVAVLILAWNLRPASTPDGNSVTTANGVVHLTAADPRALKQQIVTDLRAVGVEANGYEQLGVIGVDANLPRPLSADVQGALARHSIPAPASGELRIQISAAK
jgi:hypothetical protein